MSNMDETILCCNSIYILFIYFLKMNFRLIHLNLGITGPWSSSNSTTCQPLEIFSHGTSISLSHSLLAHFFFLPQLFIYILWHLLCTISGSCRSARLEYGIQGRDIAAYGGYWLW